MKNADLKKLATDLRINSDAVRVVIFIDSLGSGKHEIPNHKFSEILNMAGRYKVRNALDMACRAGWITREKGGWGAADFYQFLGGRPPDTVRSIIDPTEDPTEGSQFEPTEESLCVEKVTPQDIEGSKIDPTTRTREIRKRERVSSSSYKGEGCDLDPKVEATLKDERWNGIRNSLKDYFINRVQTSRQWGYLMTVQTWLDGGSAAPKGFFTLTKPEQRLLIAGAINELLAETPTQEKLNYRSSKGMEGSTNVLRVKLEFHIRRHQESNTRPKGPAQQKLQLGDPNSFFPEEVEAK